MHLQITSEDWNEVSWLLSKIVVQSEENHEGEEEAGGRQEVPDVVIVVEVEQFALRVEVARGSRGEDPAGGLVDEEVHRPRPCDHCHEDVDRGLLGDPLPVSQLHQDVEAGVQQQVDNQNKQQETGEVSSFCGNVDNLQL